MTRGSLLDQSRPASTLLATQIDAAFCAVDTSTDLQTAAQARTTTCAFRGSDHAPIWLHDLMDILHGKVISLPLHTFNETYRLRLTSASMVQRCGLTDGVITHE